MYEELEPVYTSSGEIAPIYSQNCRWAADDPTNANLYGMVYYLGGIVYNYSQCRDQIEAMLPEGWRIPTSDDITDLTSVIPTSTAGMKALMLTAFGGNNSTGFNGASAGQVEKQRTSCFEYGYPSGTLQLAVRTGTYDNSFVISHSSSQYHLKYHNNSTNRLISLRVCRNA